MCVCKGEYACVYCVWVHVHTRVHVCKGAYVCMCMCVGYMCVEECIYTCMCMYVGVHVFVRVHVHVCVCMSVWVHVCARVHVCRGAYACMWG